jgi:hypothetical protein
VQYGAFRSGTGYEGELARFTYAKLAVGFPREVRRARRREIFTNTLIKGKG